MQAELDQNVAIGLMLLKSALSPKMRREKNSQSLQSTLRFAACDGSVFLTRRPQPGAFFFSFDLLPDLPPKNKRIVIRVGLEPTRIAPLASSFQVYLKLAP